MLIKALRILSGAQLQKSKLKTNDVAVRKDAVYVSVSKFCHCSYGQLYNSETMVKNM